MMLDAASSVRVPPLNSMVPAPCIARPNIGTTTADGSACRSVTFTVPVLLNSVLIVEVVALPLLVNVPALFTTAVAPVSLPPRGVAIIVRPLGSSSDR